MIILPTLPFFITGSYLGFIFLLALAFCGLFKLFRR